MNTTAASPPPSIQDMVPNLVAQVQQLQSELSKVNSLALFRDAMSVLNEVKDRQALEAENARLRQQIANHVLIDPKEELWCSIGKEHQINGIVQWLCTDEEWREFVQGSQSDFAIGCSQMSHSYYDDFWDYSGEDVDAAMNMIESESLEAAMTSLELTGPFCSWCGLQGSNSWCGVVAGYDATICSQTCGHNVAITEMTYYDYTTGERKLRKFAGAEAEQ